MLYKCFKIVEGDWLDEEESHMIEVEFTGASDGTVVSEWSLFHSGDAAHNGSLAGDSSDYFAAQSAYKSQTVFPLMPDAETIDYYMIPDADSEYNFMSRNIYEAGDYYYFDEMVALLGGEGGSSVVAPTTETTAVASFSTEMKEAYLDIVSSVSYADFEDSWGDIPDSGEFSFDLIYYNNDDIPELLVCLTRYESYARYTGDVIYANLYTFTNGEVVELEHKMCVQSNTITNYYPRENKRIDTAYDHAGAMFYYDVVSINEDCTAMETTCYIKVNCDLAIYPDGWLEGDWDGSWYYYIYDYENHEYIEITETQFNNYITATGDPVQLVGTKTVSAITAELS